MYELLALLTGLMLSVMISVNGLLSDKYGALWAAVIVHVVGVLSALILCQFKKEKKKMTGYAPVWIYLGGVIGAFTTLCNNAAFGYISMTSIVALGLLGQAVMSLAIDCFGLFGMVRRPFQKKSLTGLVFSLAGIAIMLDDTVREAAYAVCFSLFAGITIVLSRTVNARLADKTGALEGSFINHLAGLPVTIIIALAAGNGLPFDIGRMGGIHVSARPWIYLGGTMGVIVVLLCNFTVPRISAFRLTGLTFVGQVFTGLLLDVAAGKSRPDASFAGGVVIAMGIAVNLMVEKIGAARESPDIHELFNNEKP